MTSFCSGKQGLLCMCFRWKAVLVYSLGSRFLFVSSYFVSFDIYFPNCTCLFVYFSRVTVLCNSSICNRVTIIFYHFAVLGTAWTSTTWTSLGLVIWFQFLVKLSFYWYFISQLSEEGACEDVSGDGQPSTFNEWILPAKEFDGMWERLLCNFFTFPPLVVRNQLMLWHSCSGIVNLVISNWCHLLLQLNIWIWAQAKVAAVCG